MGKIKSTEFYTLKKNKLYELILSIVKKNKSIEIGFHNKEGFLGKITLEKSCWILEKEHFTSEETKRKKE